MPRSQSITNREQMKSHEQVHEQCLIGSWVIDHTWQWINTWIWTIMQIICIWCYSINESSDRASTTDWLLYPNHSTHSLILDHNVNPG